MRAKRSKDTRLVDKFSKQREDRAAESRLQQPINPTTTADCDITEKEESDLNGVFSEVVGGKRRGQQEDGEERPKTKKKRQSGKDEEYYIPYRPKDFDSERGLSLGGEGSAFEQQASSAVLDLMGDEGDRLNQQKKMMKWDRKKKRFVRETGKEDQKKKIKTDSCQVISNKKNRKNFYEEWKKKYKIDDTGSGSDGETGGGGRKPARGRGRGRRGPNVQSSGDHKARSELKTKDQIMKQRKKKQKHQFLQGGGMSKLRSKNKKWLGELSFFHLRVDDKPALLLHLLRNVVKPQEQTVVFAATKHHVEYLKELLSSEGLECAYSYSALDQTARKINIGKFVHRKAMVLLVTDVAARGIDIPLLDNVINYNFPSKAKLFLHRVGRVGRAGRSGTAYSLICPDEMPYVYDLHLFLGRPVQFASPEHTQDSEGVFGRVPQRILDDESAHVITSHENSLDLQNLLRVSENAYKQYLKSRPNPSPESIRRVKNVVKHQPGVFSEVVGGKRRGQQEDGEERPKTKKKRQSGKDEEYYIPYRPKDFDSERGLSLGGEGSAFEQQASSAVLDLMGDEGDRLNQQKKMMKWDRKKKRFVRETGKEDQKKKIKTDSGQVISNKKNRKNFYEEWKKKYKIDDTGSGSDGETGGGGRKPARGRGRGRRGPNVQSSGDHKGRSELKTKDQIMKQRKKKQKHQFLQGGGMSKLRSKNKKWLGEVKKSGFGRGGHKKGKLRKKL
ncbi:unnamed protein product [Oreochromis niloticus]|nr:unnamed protein product [Mustela putorius furo]